VALRQQFWSKQQQSSTLFNGFGAAAAAARGRSSRSVQQQQQQQMRVHAATHARAGLGTSGGCSTTVFLAAAKSQQKQTYILAM
jgi:hypothetical protein